MEQFQGAERLIVQTIMNSPKDSAGYVADTQIATASKISVQDVQNWLETLEGKGFVQRAKITGGFKAHVTAKGKLCSVSGQPIKCQESATVARPRSR